MHIQTGPVPPLTPQTRALIERLEQPPSSWARPVDVEAGAGRDLEALIAQIGGTGELAAIPALVRFLFETPALAQAASRAIATILGRQPVRLYKALDEFRYFFLDDLHTEEGEHLRRHGLQADGVAALAQLPEGWAALGVVTCHPNGYVREAAVRALARRGEETHPEIPLLVLRLNDWVPQVRSAALEALEARLAPPFADAFVAAWPLIEHLGEQRRAAHGGFIQRVLTLLGSPAARPALLRGTASLDGPTRRASFRLALTPPATSPADLECLHRALSDTDLLIRRHAVRHLATLPPGPPRDELVLQALADASAAVRRDAFVLLDTVPPATRRQRLADVLFDGSPFLRAHARTALATLDPAVDATARYRGSLSTGPTGSIGPAGPIGPAARLRGALLGLGECGGDDDVLLLLPFLEDGRSKIRLAALQALAMLDRESIEPLVDALSDPSPRVSRTAARMIVRRPRPGLLDRMLELAEVHLSPAHVRRHALDVILSARAWTRLPYLLRAAASKHQALAALALARLSAHTTERPTPAELAAVEQALAATRLPSAVTEAIRKELRFWRSGSA